MVLVYLAAHAVQSNWSFYTIERFGWGEGMIGVSLGVVGLLVGIVQEASHELSILSSEMPAVFISDLASMQSVCYFLG